jgi:branched-chain amino acid transport system permease protein
MNTDIAVLLIEDGLASGAIYAMMALGFVLIFNVTRVIFVPFGDLVAYSALTLAAFESQKTPGTIWLVGLLSVAAFATELVHLWRLRKLHRLPRAFLFYLVMPALPVLATLLVRDQAISQPLAFALTIALILPIGPLLYRVVFEPVAKAPVLVLLIISVALHFAVSGLALLFFGPEGVRTQALVRSSYSILGFIIPAQLALVLAATAVLSALLLLFFNFTLTGKALRATAINREGARLVGIKTATMGSLAFILAGVVATVAGILISPTTTIYYDTGLIVGLKGFVGSVVGGFISYPLSVLVSAVVGLIESFSSFYASSLKEAIVFAAIIPIVLFRWLFAAKAGIDEHEDE